LKSKRKITVCVDDSTCYEFDEGVLVLEGSGAKKSSTKTSKKP